MLVPILLVEDLDSAFRDIEEALIDCDDARTAKTLLVRARSIITRLKFEGDAE